MRFRLLRRRMTIAAPTMRVSSGVAWPIRFIFFAVMVGVAAAVALWAFQFSNGITGGMHLASKEDYEALRSEVEKLRVEKETAMSVINTSDAKITVEKATQEKLAQRIEQLEQENRTLEEDLQFFQKLVPSNNENEESLAIRSLQADRISAQQIRWQVLLIQAAKNANEINGKLEVTLTGTKDDKPWTMTMPEGSVAVKLRQYKRLSGTIDFPAKTVVKTVSVKLTEGGAVRGVRSLDLP